MTFRHSIARSTVASVLLLAYLLMSMAGATHDASHAHGGSAKARTFHAAGLHLPAPQGKQGGQRASVDPGDGFCFFCAHSTVVLRAEGVEVPLRTNVYRSYPPTCFRSHHVLPPTLAVLSLRAPPAVV
ncbi:MAG TPA: hypothetical protein VHI13_06965 [Candidatus Kapabacteria bacterium]|nr:hypothetical protein [Candidatus Kapabacteria bacterium]